MNEAYFALFSMGAHVTGMTPNFQEIFSLKIRDESFITSWGGRGAVIFRGGGSECFLVMYWGGGENKMTYGQGGGHVFRQVLGGGVRCVPLVFLFIKSHSSWGAQTPVPPPLYPVSLYGIHPQVSIMCRGQLCNV